VDRWDTIDRYMILSSDAHAGAPLAGYKPYLEREWHDEFDRWLAAVVNPWHDVNDIRNWDSDARTAAMDEQGVTGEVIFPNTLPPFYDTQAHLSGVPRDRRKFERRWAGLRAHNRWLVEFCSAEPARRRGLVQLLPNDIDAAIAEMRWAREHDVVGGVMIPAIPPNHEVQPFWHERYDPLWAAAAELGLPVHQHQGSGSPDVGSDQEVARTITYIEHEVWTARTLLHLIAGGVFDRHPDLRVVWTEMPGLRWAVEQLERATRQLQVVQSRFAADPTQLNYSRTFGSAVTEGLTKTPIEYFRSNCYIGASMMPRHDMVFVAVLGSDRIMWGHDFPHEEGSCPHTTAALRATLHDVPDEECRWMLAGTAAGVYHFDLDALTPVAARVGPPVSLVHTSLQDVPTSRGSAFWEPDPLAVALGAQPAAR
jgi:predicted TIM-barrel fold metal-dependent hydrolase